MTGVVAFLFVVCVVLLIWSIALQSDVNDARRRIKELDSTSAPSLLKADVSKLESRCRALEQGMLPLARDWHLKPSQTDLQATNTRHLRLAKKVDRLSAALHGLFAATDLAAEDMDKQP